MIGKLIDLFKWIYEHSLGIFVSKETGEIFTRAAFIAAVIATLAAVYTAYAFAVSTVMLAIPAELSWSLTFLPDNTSACLTIVTGLRVALYVLSLQLGAASIGVK